MPNLSGNQEPEIRRLARYQVRPEALDRVLRRCMNLLSLSARTSPERNDPTRFVNIFVFRDAEADRIHSESPEVKKFAGILYPECLAPVEFIDYQPVVSNTEWRR